MKVCGVDRPEDIDYSQPNVHLEWFLCDIRMLTRLQHGQREEVMALMDESQRETYLHGCDLEGRPYTDLEKQSIRSGIAEAIKARRKARWRTISPKGTPGPSEVPKSLKSAKIRKSIKS
jgi:hypothetical protein